MLNKLLIVLTIFFSCTSITCASESDDAICDWIMYLGVGPDYIDTINPEHSIDIYSKYKYPLYVGYIYTTDSKNIKWHAEVDFIESKMKKWANRYSKYPLYAKIEVDGEFSWRLDSPDFFKASVLLMHHMTKMRVLRYERNVPIDKDWKPIFNKQVSVEDSIIKAQQEISFVNGDFNPTNWNSEKNTY